MRTHGDGGDRNELYSRRTCVRRRPAAPGLERRHAERNQYRDAAHPPDPSQPADPLRGDGHRDRGEARDRHGGGRRHRRHPPQSRARGSGRGGAQGQEVRERHGGRSDHHLSRRDAGRCARAHAPRLDLGHSGGRARSRRQAGEARRHSHQPRRALRRRSAPAGDGPHDPQGGDGRRGGEPRGGSPPPASQPHREAGRRRRRGALRRPHHGQGHREGDRPPERRQGRRRAPARRRRDLCRRQGVRARRDC